MYLNLPVVLQRDRLPPLTVQKPMHYLFVLHLNLMVIFILWWLWLIMVLQIALYTNVLSSSANYCEFRSQIWLVPSQMVVLFLTLVLLMFPSAYLVNLPLLICQLDVICWITYLVTWSLAWIGYKHTIL